MRTAAAWSGGGRIAGGIPKCGVRFLKVYIILVIGSSGEGRLATNEKTARPPLKGAEPMGRKLMLANWEEHSLPATASMIAATAGITARTAATSAVVARSGRTLARRAVTRGALPLRRAVAGCALTGRIIAGALANHRRRDP